jgi:HlyD family secretion protein
VKEGQVVAQIWPLPLSARERDEQLARIAAAEALSREAAEQVRRAQAEHEQASRERRRVDQLVKDGFVSPQAAEQAKVLEVTSANALEAARYRARSAEAELRAARAALLAIGAPAGAQAAVSLRSPVSGRVLRIPEKSERVVASGTPLLVLGDPARLEVVADVLSTDAVRVRPGMPVLLEGWGGDRPLRAVVRVVEPYAFTKVSALGVEEQRVNVVADFVDPPGPLGDAYRVDARIVVWSADKVLKAPASALFRSGNGWAAFVVDGGRARRREVQVGERSAREAQILGGLKAGDLVIRYPSNEISDGIRVQVRAGNNPR